MTLIIENVKEEYLPAFKEFAEKMEANINAESVNECPICKSYDYQPSDDLLEAIAEVERGEGTHCKDFEEYLIKINE